MNIVSHRARRLMKPRAPSALHSMSVIGLGLLLAGCAGLQSADPMIRDAQRDVQRTVQQRLQLSQPGWPDTGVTAADDSQRQARIRELLSAPLTIQHAVELALLNNRSVQSGLLDIGLGAHAVIRAGTLPNPHVALMRASHPEGSGREYKIEQALTLNLIGVLALPYAQAAEQRQFEATRLAVTQDILKLALDTRKAWIMAVAAEQAVHYQSKVKEAAAAGAELSRRMTHVGNASKLQQAREHSFYADAALNQARAEQQRLVARERLLRLLGLGGEPNRMTLPDRLPDLPKAVADQPDIEQRAMNERLDLQAVRLRTEALAKNLGLTRATRLINVLEAGPARVLEGPRSAAYKTGYEVSFELPLFDFGTSRVAQAELRYQQALITAAEAASTARSEVREAYLSYRLAHDMARHWRDEIVPLRKRIADETLLRYNGMLIGVFELLADARTQIASVHAALDAERDFWLADADLQMALIGRPDLNAAIAGAPGSSAATSTPSAQGGH